MNRYALWKYILISLVVIFGVLYSLPNLFGSDPALQVTSARGSESGQLTEFAVSVALDETGVKAKAIEPFENHLIVRFNDEEAQLKAQEAIQKQLGNDYVVALNLAPATPKWLGQLNAEPMFLGLDLRGGVHFLMEVDMKAAIAKAEDRYVADLRTLLRENKVRYKTITRQDNGGLLMRYKDEAQRQQAIEVINDEFPELVLTETDTDGIATTAVFSEEHVKDTRGNAVKQNITTLRNRVNELGVAEPIIQQQGQDRIVVELPGIQDTAAAKDVLGATATLEFRMVDEVNNVNDAVNGRVPIGSKLYRMDTGEPILLKKQIIITGDCVTDASSGLGQQGGPVVNIRLSGPCGKIMSKLTAENIGKRMAVVFIENKTETIFNDDGSRDKKSFTEEKVISAAVIRGQFGNRFEISGLDSTEEARTLALLLRAGALAAPIEIVEERTVGPSLGKDNIERGFNSVMIGFVLVLIFMVIYYGMFGLFADIALTLNLVLLVALLSLLQATLTLPGIAGIVLTVGMAVDANVLIFERIREELRNGNSPQASIYAGYQKAFSTIADANITTLIAAIVLFSFGTGPIKGFAVTLSLGIICSMFTAIMVTRALVNLYYGGRKIEKLSI